MKNLLVVLVLFLCNLQISFGEDTLETFVTDVYEPADIHFIDNATGFICGNREYI